MKFKTYIKLIEKKISINNKMNLKNDLIIMVALMFLIQANGCFSFKSNSDEKLKEIKKSNFLKNFLQKNRNRYLIGLGKRERERDDYTDEFFIHNTLSDFM